MSGVDKHTQNFKTMECSKCGTPVKRVSIDAISVVCTICILEQENVVKEKNKNKKL